MEWALVAEMAAGFASIVSLLFVAWQLRALARQTKASTDALRAAASVHTFTTAVETDRFFADRPELRSIFYGKLAGDADQLQLHRVDAVAEMMLDQFMMAATQMEHMSPELRLGWRQYVRHVMDRSPALRDFYERNKDWYDLIDDIENPPDSAIAIGVARHRRGRTTTPRRPVAERLDSAHDRYASTPRMD